MRKLHTLCIIYKDSQVLLGMKKVSIGAGKWNGFGGKVEEGESIDSATSRELLEESGLVVGDLEKMGVMNFDFQDGSRGMEVHIYRSNDFSGDLVESDEMRPQWFEMDDIPLQDMWPSDAFWFPMLLEGRKFNGRFLYDAPSGTDHTSVVLEKSLEEAVEL